MSTLLILFIPASFILKVLNYRTFSFMVLMKHMAVHLFQLIFHLVLNPYFLFYVSVCYSHVICTLTDFGLMSFSFFYGTFIIF